MMRLRLRLIGFVIVTIGVTAILVVMSRASLSFERALKRDADDVIATLNGAPLKTIDAGDLAKARAALADNESSRIGILAGAGRIARVDYFRGRRLLATDRNDERGDMIRRDYVDTEERVRLRVFYGNSTEYLAHYLNERGDVVRVEVLGPVPMGVRPIYGG